MKKHLQTRVFAAVMLAVFMIVIGCVILNYSNYVSANKEYTSSLAETVANTCALIMDGDKVETYLETGRRDTEYYEIWNKLIDYKNLNSAIVELNVVSFDEDGGHIAFDTDLDKNSGLLWDTYNLDIKQSAVRKELLACQNDVSIAYADHMDLYVPIKSSYNIPVAYVIVGIDTQNTQKEQIQYLVKMTAIVTGIALIFGMILLVFIHYAVVRHINALTYAASRYSEKRNLEDDSPLQKVKIHTGDELEALLISLKKMENDIRDSSMDLALATWNSNHDSMTQLYNKRFYNEMLEKLKTRENTGIIYFDIDNLKKMNDIHGHDKGDEVIMKTADFVKKYEQDGTVSCRIGGDEFVMIIPDTSEQQLLRLLDQMHEDEDGMLAPQITEFCCRIAIGGTVQERGERIEETIKRAENFMYGDKHSKR